MNDHTVILGAQDATLSELMRLFPNTPGAKLREFQKKKAVTPVPPSTEIMGMGESREERKSGLYIPLKGYMHVGHGYDKNFKSVYAIGTDQVSTELRGIFIPEALPLNPFTVQSGPTGVSLLRIPYQDVPAFFLMTGSRAKFLSYQSQIMSEVLKSTREKNIVMSIQEIFLKALDQFVTACPDQFQGKILTKGVLMSCSQNPDQVDPRSLLEQISQSIAGDLDSKMKPLMQKLVCAHALTYGMLRMLEE